MGISSTIPFIIHLFGDCKISDISGDDFLFYVKHQLLSFAEWTDHDMLLCKDFKKVFNINIYLQQCLKELIKTSALKPSTFSFRRLVGEMDSVYCAHTEWVGKKKNIPCSLTLIFNKKRAFSLLLFSIFWPPCFFFFFIAPSYPLSAISVLCLPQMQDKKCTRKPFACYLRLALIRQLDRTSVQTLNINNSFSHMYKAG